jgi:serine/threonine-protein kinase
VHQGQTVTTKIATKPFFTRRSALLYGGSFFAAIALSITGFLLSGNQNNGPLIPNVVGLSEAQARELLSGYVITVKRAHDGTIPKDRIASQSPLATTSAPLGSAIVLTISDGPGDAIVPDDLLGMALIDARAALTAVGLTVSQTIAAPSDQPQGTVLDVSPPVGSITTAGSGVILTIASGEVTVPSLVGVEAIQAKTTLIQVGFLIKEFYDYDATQPLGVVIRQAPDAGTTQIIGNSVTITINRQP